MVYQAVESMLAKLDDQHPAKAWLVDKCSCWIGTTMLRDLDDSQFLKLLASQAGPAGPAGRSGQPYQLMLTDWVLDQRLAELAQSAKSGAYLPNLSNLPNLVCAVPCKHPTLTSLYQLVNAGKYPEDASIVDHSDQYGYSGCQLLVEWFCDGWLPSKTVCALVKMCVERHDMLVGPWQRKYAILLARACRRYLYIVNATNTKWLLPTKLLNRIVRIGNSLGTSVSFPGRRYGGSVPAMAFCTHVAVASSGDWTWELIDAQIEGLRTAIDAPDEPHSGVAAPLNGFHWLTRLVWRLIDLSMPYPAAPVPCRIIVPIVCLLARLHLVSWAGDVGEILASRLLELVHHVIWDSKLAICEQQHLAKLAVQAGILDWMKRASTANFIATYGCWLGSVDKLRSWLESVHDHPAAKRLRTTQ